MNENVFVDTNVLVYVRDRTEPEKQRRAADWMAALWESRKGRIGFQVLHEYYVTATRKLDPPRAPADVREDIEALRAWHPLPVDFGTIEGAWRIEDRYGLAWWDALIVSAALESGCAFLLTEDLQDQQTLDGLTVLNPFRQPPGEIVPGGGGERG